MENFVSDTSTAKGALSIVRSKFEWNQVKEGESGTKFGALRGKKEAEADGFGTSSRRKECAPQL